MHSARACITTMQVLGQAVSPHLLLNTAECRDAHRQLLCQLLMKPPPQQAAEAVNSRQTATHLAQSMIFSVCHIQHIEMPAVDQALRRKEGCLSRAAIPQASAIAPNLHLEDPRQVRDYNPADAKSLEMCTSAAACMLQTIQNAGAAQQAAAARG